MSEFVITTESNCDLPKSYVEEHQIGVIPHYYTVDEEMYGEDKELTNKEFNIIEAQLEDLYPDGIDETQLNDIFRFEQDFVAQMLGYDTWEAFEKTKED